MPGGHNLRQELEEVDNGRRHRSEGVGELRCKNRTLHQFRVRRVDEDVDKHAPEEYNAGGVVLEYRKYSSDEVMEITGVSSGGRKGWGEGRFQFTPKWVISHWWPAPEEKPARLVLQLPQGEPPLAEQNADWKHADLFSSISAAIGNGGSYRLRFTDAAREDWASTAARATEWEAGEFLPQELCIDLVAKVLALRHGGQQQQQQEKQGSCILLSYFSRGFKAAPSALSAANYSF